MKSVSRGSGRSAVASAAYRAAEKLENQRDGLVHDFTRRSGVEHAEIMLPDGVAADWAKDRSALWNAAEASEKRRDARVAREIEVALPHELSAGQRIALTRDFAQGLADRYGVAVDFAIHSPHGHTDVRNHHAHIMMTTRRVGAKRSAEAKGFAGSEVLGEKSDLELENKKLQALGLPTSHAQLRDIRLGWEERTNAHLAQAGLDMRIDHRSHQERGLEIEPTQHIGVHATQMERRGLAVSRGRMDEGAAQRNADLIREKPEQVLTLITGEKSVFDRRDIARTLHRYVDEPQAFQSAMAKVMASPALVELQAERKDDQGRVLEGARYSTREMVGVERDMAVSADRMAASGGFGVAGRRVEDAIAAYVRSGIRLTDEQCVAVRHLAGSERISAVVGLAGAGKSTMLAAARGTWEAEGYRVQGAALAGKAAEGLEESSGIPSRTLASWERGWERGFDQLTARDVFVIDEAGMVGSKQLSRFIQAADQAGAKVVLVGDPEQLQPIGPGAAFRAIAERVGFVELEDIRRQREDWQRVASVDFGRHRTAEGLAAYAERGAVHLAETGEAARATIVRDVMADMAARPDRSRLVLAHRNADVQALNEAIRADRKERGELAGEIAYRTTEGERAFAPGDRVLFRENNRDLGVKNGMLGTVERVAGPVEGHGLGEADRRHAEGRPAEGHPAEGERLVVRLDSAQGPGSGRSVSVSMEDYAAVDHGYATTIHKAQGATVDRAYVLASGTMDRHLTYVAMTRHRDGVQLYAGQDEFRDVGALSGRLSRSQAKETTLDYAQRARTPETETNSERTFEGQKHHREEEQDLAPFAARRGLRGTGLVPQSEIVVPDIARAASPADGREQERGAARPTRGTRGQDDSLRAKVRAAQARREVRPAEARPAKAADKGPAEERAPEKDATAERERQPGLFDRDVSTPDVSTPNVSTRGMSTPGMFDGLALGGGRERREASEREAVPGITASPAEARGSEGGRAGDAVPEQAIASGRAGFRERYEAHKRQQALEAARDEQARGLVRQWEQLADAYNKALPELERDPNLGGTRAPLLRFGDALQSHPDATQALRERGAEFGIEKGSPLAQVLADRQPSRMIGKLMNGVEEAMHAHLKEQAAERLEQRRSRGRGMSMGR